MLVGYSHSLKDHVSPLRIWKVLRKNHLYVKLLWTDGDPGIRAIEEWQAPTKVSELRSFLGLVNYYRRFIVSDSKRDAQLSNFLKKDVRTDHGTSLFRRV